MINIPHNQVQMKFKCPRKNYGTKELEFRIMIVTSIRTIKGEQELSIVIQPDYLIVLQFGKDDHNFVV